ncbi:MAG TPA: hypothetical protein VLM79_33585 [Kofleriaceae bacterium]|nr:hypothetical protein [Kofleriaceae bacterium]
MEEDCDDLTPGPPRFSEPVTECDAVHVFHGNEHLIAECTDFMDRHDIGVLNARHGLRFAPQLRAGPRSRIARDRGVQELECHLAIELRIIGGINGSHAAAAEDIEDDEAPDGGAARQGICF